MTSSKLQETFSAKDENGGQFAFKKIFGDAKMRSVP